MASEKDQAEQSALINLDSLEVKRSRGNAGQVPFEESGLIDLSGFTGGGPAETRETAGVPSGGPVAASFVPAPKKSNTGLYVGLALLVALLVGGAAYVGVMMATQNQTQQPVAQTPTTPAPAAQTPTAPAAAATPAPTPAAAAAADAGKPDATPAADAGVPDAAPQRAVAANRPRPRPSRSARPPAPRPSAPSPSAEDAPPAAEPRTVRVTPPPQPAPTPPPKPAATSEVDDMLSALDGKPSGGGSPAAQAKPAADPMLPERLGRRQILTVVKRNAGAVRKCKSQPPGQSATVTIKMQIAGNGTVSGADVAGGPLKGTPQGNCVERTVKVFRFPQFSGPPMQINMPFQM